MGILDNLAGISSESKEQDLTPQAGVDTAPQPKATASQERGGTKDAYREALLLLKSNLPEGFVSAKFEADGNLAMYDDAGERYVLFLESSNIMWHLTSAYLTNIEERLRSAALERCNALNDFAGGHFAAHFDERFSAIFMNASGCTLMHDGLALHSDIIGPMIQMRSAHKHQF